MLWKNRNKKVGLCVVVVMASLVLVVVWAVLTTPETALAAKGGKPGGGGGSPEVLRGKATFRDADDDLVKSDLGGPEGDESSYTYTGPGKGAAVLLGLEGFFRLKVQLDKKGNGRSFDLSIPDLGGNNEAFEPASESVWTLVVNATLAEFRDQDENVAYGKPGYIYYGVNGKDEARINFGAGNLARDEALLTVTRTGLDVWTIQSFAPGDPEDPDGYDDVAMFYRPDLDLICGYAPMPFKIEYDGRAPSP